MTAGTVTGCGGEQEASSAAAAADPGQKADAEEQAADQADSGAERQGDTQLKAIPAQDIKEGTYSVQVDSSSSKFRITDCQLTVKDGSMTAVMTMGGTGYLKVFMGTGEEALKAEEEDFIPYEETAEGTHTFTVPVAALDQELPCSAFSKRKESWYDRTLVFRSDSLPEGALLASAGTAPESLGLEDGFYRVEARIEGGSGRASVQSPAAVRVEHGRVWITLEWSSSNYDYMKVEDVVYQPLPDRENSVFEVPVTLFDGPMAVIADTVAMSQPYEIQYRLFIDSTTLEKTEGEAAESSAASLLYAEQFTLEDYEGGCTLITIKDSGRWLVVPEQGKVPEKLPADVKVLRQPIDEIYLAATSAMDHFAGLGAVDQITLSGTKKDGWYIDEAREAMEKGTMVYAGKYNAPDYELILSRGCSLAVESTMIYHAPEVKEQLERLGIPVLVERSSYESHPLGRVEWIKLYGALLGREEEAERLFEEQRQQLEQVMAQKPSGKKAAFFYITSNGYVNVRKPGDYVTKMIELAGGSYLPQVTPEEENALSTMNMDLETFYKETKDADCIIYNSTAAGQLRDLEDLLDKNSLLADFKAVKEGNVWCTEKNMFQETMGQGDMILDIHKVLTEEEPENLTYLYRLE